MLFSRNIFFLLAILLLSFALLALSHSEKLNGLPDNVIKLTGNEEHSITLDEASKLTSNFQNQAEPDQIIAGYFGREAILSILQQEGCVGIRYYYGLKDNGKPTLILVGVDEVGNDIIDGVLAQRPIPCPPACGEDNDLNSPVRTVEISANF
ncbi:MAG: hypothetical protein ACE5IW_07915 [bacterium]